MEELGVFLVPSGASSAGLVTTSETPHLVGKTPFAEESLVRMSLGTEWNSLRECSGKSTSASSALRVWSVQEVIDSAAVYEVREDVVRRDEHGAEVKVAGAT